MAGLGNFVAGDRVGLGIERGIFVAIVKAEADAIDALTAESSPPSCKHSTTATAATATSSKSAGACSTGAATARTGTEHFTASTAAPSPAARSALALIAGRAGNQTLLAKTARSAACLTLADSSLEQKRVGGRARVRAALQRGFGLRTFSCGAAAVRFRGLRICAFTGQVSLLEAAACEAFAKRVSDAGRHLAASSGSAAVLSVALGVALAITLAVGLPISLAVAARAGPVWI